MAEAYIQLQQDTHRRMQDRSSNAVMIQAPEQSNGNGLYFGIDHPSTAAQAPPGFQTFLVPNHYGGGSAPYIQQQSYGNGLYFGGGIAQQVTAAPVPPGFATVAPVGFATAAPPPPGFQTYLAPNQHGWVPAPYMQQASNGSGLYFGGCIGQHASAAPVPPGFATVAPAGFATAAPPHPGFQTYLAPNQHGWVPAPYMQQPPTGSGLYFGGCIAHCAPSAPHTSPASNQQWRDPAPYMQQPLNGNDPGDLGSQPMDLATQESTSPEIGEESSAAPSTSSVAGDETAAPSISSGAGCEAAAPSTSSGAGGEAAAPSTSLSSSSDATALNGKRGPASDGSEQLTIKKAKVSASNCQGLECNTIQSAFKGRIFNSRIENTLEILDPRVFLDECKELIIKEVESVLQRSICGLKMHCSMELEYSIRKPDEEKSLSTGFNSKPVLILPSSDLNQIFSSIAGDILENISKFEGGASSKSLVKILSLVMGFTHYDPLHAGSYIELPLKIRNKTAIINIKNEDNFCFAWCMLASKYPVKRDGQRTTVYPKELLFEAFNYEGIEYPTPLHQIECFEKQNNGVSISVFGIEEENENIIPLYQTAEKKQHHTNLLYIEQGEKSHYCIIKDLSRLVRSQVTKYQHRVWTCEACLKRCTNEKALETHRLRCGKCQLLKMPQQDEYLEFKAFSKSVPVPFVIYADIESVLAKVHSCEPSSSSSWTRAVQEHEAMSIALKVICRHDESMSKFFLFRGPNAVDDFIKQLKSIADDVIDVYSNPKPMDLTLEEQQNFDNASECHICLAAFTVGDLRVRDHDHVTGEYLGAAHNRCNLNRKVPDFIPIFFHCLSNYDSHFLIRRLAYDNKPVSCIAQSGERYIAFSKRYRNISFRFLDSFKFLDDKLSSLAYMLEESDFKITRAEYPVEEHFKLAKSKGIFPYDYVSSLAVLEETSLPPKEAFYSTLTDSHITEEEYRHAVKVWEVFNIRNLGEYSDLYLKTDILLLADIFEKFRDLILGMYKLDPAWFYTLPGLAFDAMLKITKAKLSLISDKGMLEFFESGIRGGLCTVVKGYTKANHRYMSNFDQHAPVKHLSYWDINNLYGASMVSALPYKNLKWLTREEIEGINFAEVKEDSETGYVLEVDIEYPDHIHDAHNELPFCPQSAIPPNGQYKKLLATLEQKSKYVLHYRVMQQCIEQGLTVRHIHRVVSYDQSNWLKTYIDVNTEKRAQEKSKFGQNLWKKMNNAVYGKFIENVRKYTDFKIVGTWEQAKKLIARSTYLRTIIFEENLVGIELGREEVHMNKPIYIGHAILDISKFIMYDFFYNIMKPNLKDLLLNYMDTDSFIFETSSDIYEFIRENPQYFDTSNFEKDNVYGIKQANRKKIGLFKDELGGLIMEEYVGIRAKL